MSSRRLPLFTSLSAALLLAAPAPASAFSFTPKLGVPTGPICAAPTASQCADPAWLDSFCGHQRMGECAFAPYADLTEWLLDDLAARDRLDEAEVVMEDQTFGAAVTALAASELPIYSPDPAAANWTSAELTWAASPAIASCDEYVFERFYGYFGFRAAAREFGADWGALFDWAHAGGVSLGEARSRFQIGAVAALSTTDLVFHNSKGAAWATDQLGRAYEMDQPKNIFFALQGDARAALAAVDPALAAKLDAGRAYYQVDDVWAWHATMDFVLRALAQTPDDVLAYHYEQGERFRSTLAERYAVGAERARAAVYGASAADLVDLDLRLAAFDAQLYDLLVEAEAAGCLDVPAGVNPSPLYASVCDWAPQRFFDDVVRGMDQHVNRERRRCLETTGDDLDALTDGFWRVWGHHFYWYGSDPTVHLQAFVNYLAAQDDLIAYAAELVGGEGAETPRWSQATASGDAVGGWLLGGAWSQDAAWSVTTPAGTTESHVCRANVTARSHVDAGATLLGHDYDLAAITAEIDVTSRRYAASVQVLGDVHWSQGQHQGYTATTPINFALQAGGDAIAERELVGDDQTFWVFGFPVTVDYALVGAVGLDGRWEARRSGGWLGESKGCTSGFALSLEGSVRPFARIGAEASAGIGLPGLSAGIRGAVTLVEVGTPLDLAIDMTMEQPGQAQSVRLTVDATSKTELSSLDGSLSAYVKYPKLTWSGVKTRTATKNIVSWRGLTSSHTAFQSGFDVPLQLFREICDLDAVDCQ